MKSIKYMKSTFAIKTSLILVWAILLGTTSCEKFLDTELKGTRSDAQFYQTANDAELALTGVYNLMSFAESNNRLWVFGDVASDDAAKGGIAGDQADIGFIDEFNISADNGNLEAVWAICYSGISRANKLLDHINAIPMDADRKSQITGEAKFLRAYYYYWLGVIWGNVPVHLTTPTPEDMQKAVTPSDQLFGNVIEADLNDAISLLPETFSGGNLGRATKYAALGLLTKVYLIQNKWAEAEDAARQIVNSGLFQLHPLYRANFELATKDNPEIVFAVQHLAGQDPWLGNRLNQWFAPRAKNGYGFNAPTQNFVDEFEETAGGVVDPRLDYTVGRAGMPWFNDSVLFDPEWSSTGYLNKKYIQPLEEVPVESKADGELNYQFIRYADVLLMLAEALNEQGKSGEAVVYVNEVRQRARESYLHDEKLPGYPDIPEGLLSDITYDGTTEVRDAIRHERRVELGFEFHRYFDIIRYGAEYANQVFGDKPNFNFENNKFMPIPQSETDTNFEL
jgi:starch-binding outer membrane protein, SusD/RagB family